MKPEEFDLLLHQTGGLWVVDFWAPWCGPCKVTRPVLEKLASDYQERVKFLAVNADDSPELAARYRVLGIPTVIALRDGNEAARLTGAQSQSVYRGMFEALVNGKTMPAGIAPIERMLRLGAGAVLGAAGLSSGSLVLIALGGLVAFLGIYDRCPVWKAIRGTLFPHRSRGAEEIDQRL